MRVFSFVISMCILTTISCLTFADNSSINELEKQSRNFMDGYAKDLRNGDGVAVADRYNRTGAYFVGGGHKVFKSFNSIRDRYLKKWKGPSSFEWQNLSYEFIESDSVMVTGTFKWGRGNSMKPLVFSYTGLLTRQEGELRIRLEDESLDPKAIKESLCADYVPTL